MSKTKTIPDEAIIAALLDHGTIRAAPPVKRAEQSGTGGAEGAAKTAEIFLHIRVKGYGRGQATRQALIFVQSQCNYSAIYRQSYFLEGQGTYPLEGAGYPRRQAPKYLHTGKF